MSKEYTKGRFFLFVHVLCMAILITSCNRSSNKLNSDDLNLKEKILFDEAEKASRGEDQEGIEQIEEYEIGRTYSEEIRKEDPVCEVKVLDIIGSRKSYRAVNLSQISSDIHYLVLSCPIDSTFMNHVSQVVFTPEFIYAKSMEGIACFDKKGQFLNIICQNKKDITQVSTTGGVKVTSVTSAAMKTFYGYAGDIYAIGDRIFYQYKDYTENKHQLIVFDPEEDITAIQIQSDTEGNQNKVHLGSVIRDFKEISSVHPYFYPLDEHTYGKIPRKLYDGSDKSILISFNHKGDTVCVFSDFDPVINYTNTVGRSVEQGDKYYLDQQFHYRPRFNDTVFRLLPPNRLIPKYAIDFGGKGIPGSKEGIDPKFILAESFVHSQFTESNDHIFIEYTQDYSSFNTQKRGSLKYNRCVYFKKSGNLIHIQMDTKAEVSKDNEWGSFTMINLHNDLDQGLDFWPEGITETGTPFMKFSGEYLNSEIQEHGCKSEELIDIANSIKDNEIVIILAK